MALHPAEVPPKAPLPNLKLFRYPELASQYALEMYFSLFFSYYVSMMEKSYSESVRTACSASLVNHYS